MFLSDGDITLGAKGEAFLAKLKILNHADFRMRLFTYSFGFTSPMMTQMACAHNGLFQTIPDENPELLKETMAKYYEFFAAGIHDTGLRKARWSEIYVASASQKPCLTATFPVYDLLQVPKQLFGVLGVDLVPGSMMEMSDFNSTLADLHAQTRACPTFEMSDEQLESLRKRLSGSTCAAAGLADTSNEKKAFAAIAVGATGSAALVAIVIMLIRRRSGRQGTKQAPPDSGGAVAPPPVVTAPPPPSYVA